MRCLFGYFHIEHIILSSSIFSRPVQCTQYICWWPESGVHWRWPGPRTCPCQGEDLSWAGETQWELTCALYRCTGLYRQLHTDTDQVNMETPWVSHRWHRWHHGACWGGDQVTVKEWGGVSSWSQGRSWSRPCVCTVSAWVTKRGASGLRPSYSKPISPISDVMWIDLRSAGLRAAWSCLPPLPMLWFTLGINKSRPGSRIGSWIAIWYLHLSSPLPRHKLCTAIAWPQSIMIYMVCVKPTFNKK